MTSRPKQTIARHVVALLGVGLLLGGCSLVDSPETGEGMVSLRFVRQNTAPDIGGPKDADPLARALAIADSIRVDVYPPGTGGTPETGMGAPIPALADTVKLDLTVIAEANKRVAVRLFTGGVLEYWGANEDVDVQPNQNTQVSILAVSFTMSPLAVSPTRLWDDEPFTVFWPSVAGATGYHIQASTTPDFSSIAFETFVADTFATDSVPAGNYYLRVAARNVYAESAWNGTQVHVGGAPVISGLSRVEMLRGYPQSFDVYGSDLDHASTQVSVFGQNCTIDAVSPTQLSVTVTPGARAFSDNVTVSNNFGSGASSALLKIQAIAYVMGDASSGDATAANTYKAMIDAYGANTRESTVVIVPYTYIGLLIDDMSIFDVIVIGHDTGTDDSDWGGGGVVGAQRAGLIRSSGAAVMGIGIGGAAYFQMVGLQIGIKSCKVDLSRQIYVVDPSSAIYQTPNTVTSVPGVLQIYQTILISPTRLGVDSPGNGITQIGAWTATAKEWAFCDEPTVGAGTDPHSNFLWGFEGDPSNLTAASGLPLFHNVVAFLFSDGTKDVAP